MAIEGFSGSVSICAQNHYPLLRKKNPLHQYRGHWLAFVVPSSLPSQPRAYLANRYSHLSYKLGPRVWESLPSALLLELEFTPKPRKGRRKERSYYLRYACTCSCPLPASRCLFQDRKLQHFSSPGARHAHLWHTAVH